MSPYGPWLDHRLNAFSVRLWGVLVLESGNGDRTKVKFHLLAKALRTTSENVEASIEQLAEAGYIDVTREGRNHVITLKGDEWAARPELAPVELV